jgi:tripartite-type tricarboxylate transporter receptor subunit TctC
LRSLARETREREALYIPFAAGGDFDLSGRNLGYHASKYLNNRPIVSLKKVGAPGAIGSTCRLPRWGYGNESAAPIAPF